MKKILYHWTEKKNLNNILKKGLQKNKIGLLYLTKFPKAWKNLHKDKLLLKVVVPKNLRLSCFEEYKDGTEILCWGNIPKQNIEVIK